MCTNGINAQQFKTSIDQIDETVALVRRWTHRAFHAAEDGQQPRTAAKLKEAQGLLDEVRALLTDAQDTIDRDIANASDISVNLV